MHAEGDELDEEEHVGDGDTREEAVDGGAVHLLRGEHTYDVYTKEGGGQKIPPMLRIFSTEWMEWMFIQMGQVRDAYNK